MLIQKKNYKKNKEEKKMQNARNFFSQLNKKKEIFEKTLINIKKQKKIDHIQE